MRILVGIPYNGGNDPPARAALDALDWCGAERQYDIRKNYGVDMARNRIAAHAVSGGFDWLLFVDADVILPPDALENLLEHDADVCMGWYLNRHDHGDSQRTCLYAPGSGWSYFKACDLRAKRDGGTYTIKAKGGGLGCCLVRVSALDAVKFPWFEWKDVKFDRSTGKVDSCGEDIDFCNKCEQAGIQVYADTRVECEHLK